MRKFLLVCMLCVGLPLSAEAAIEISEIAWMGSTESANHEWIELYNSGPATDVTGWNLSAGNTIIDLEGVIAANSRVVLERTSDASARGTAFIIYTGALTNGGATLLLRNNAGTIVDQVTGGSDWNAVGGDNQTKQTAQKTSNGWITAPATPGQGTDATESSTVSVAVEAELLIEEMKEDVRTNKVVQANSKKANDAIVLTLPDITLQLEIVSPQFVYVNQPVPLSFVPSGVGDLFENSLQYIWNFGDATTGQGADVTHTFSHAGRYVVVVQGGYKRQQQVARVEIDVLPTALSLMVKDKHIVINNEGDSEIDLGNYRLVGHNELTIPAYTILLPGQSIAIPLSKVSQSNSDLMVVLYDQIGYATAMRLPVKTTLTKVAHIPSVGRPPVFTDVNTPAPARRISALSDSRILDQSPNLNDDRFGFAAHGTTDTRVTNPLATKVAQASEGSGVSTTSQLAAVTPAGHTLPAQWPLYALAGILLLGILCVYLIPFYPRGET